MSSLRTTPRGMHHFLCGVLVSWLCGACPLQAATQLEAVRQYIQQRVTNGTDTATLMAAGIALTESVRLAQLYAQRHHATLWSDATGLSPQVAPILDMLRQARNEGLDPEDYHLSLLETLVSTIQSDQQAFTLDATRHLADFDLVLSDAVLSYMRHLSRGRWRPTTHVMAAIPTPASLEPMHALREADTSTPLPEVLARLTPTHQGYVRLRQALARYRSIAATGGWPRLPQGPSLRTGDRGLAVLLLKMRLEASGDLVSGGAGDRTMFDAALVQAVRHFQRRHGLAVDGVIGQATRRALQMPVEERVRQLRLNLDRWRWLPRQLGSRHIRVNIPAFTLQVVENERETLSMRIVVGKPSRPTPLLHSTLPLLVLNPAWNIPARIAREEILPLVQRDQTYLATHNITIVPVQDAQATDVSPSNLNLAAVSSHRLPFRLRQEPGPSNALGRIKFMMPNPFQVYLHDTPSKQVFGKPVRAASHGCIRLEQPVALAAYLLQDHPRWNRAALLEAIATGDSRRVPIPTTLPIYVIYHTAWVSADDTVHFRPDIYGWDRLLQENLGTTRQASCG